MFVSEKKKKNEQCPAWRVSRVAGRKLSDGDNRSSVHGAAPKGISPSSFSFLKQYC